MRYINTRLLLLLLCDITDWQIRMDNSTLLWVQAGCSTCPSVSQLVTLQGLRLISHGCISPHERAYKWLSPPSFHNVDRALTFTAASVVAVVLLEEWSSYIPYTSPMDVCLSPLELCVPWHIASCGIRPACLLTTHPPITKHRCCCHHLQPSTALAEGVNGKHHDLPKAPSCSDRLTSRACTVVSPIKPYISAT